MQLQSNFGQPTAKPGLFSVLTQPSPFLLFFRVFKMSLPLIFLPSFTLVLDLVCVLHRHPGTYFTDPLSLMTALPVGEKSFVHFVSEVL